MLDIMALEISQLHLAPQPCSPARSMKLASQVMAALTFRLMVHQLRCVRMTAYILHRQVHWRRWGLKALPSRHQRVNMMEALKTVSMIQSKKVQVTGKGNGLRTAFYHRILLFLVL
uniref:Uncharacterized protein n=1 Tax=Arundo donax TaxID=35708 RepID=A0A0A9EL29_ARUDO